MTVEDGTEKRSGAPSRPGARNAGRNSREIPRQRDGGLAGQGLLRELARRGELGRLSPSERTRLRPAAYELAHAIVYDVVTRRVARTRGHGSCARGLGHLEESCLDGFHRDLEAVTDHLLVSTQQIGDLEGWLVKRAFNAAIDGHRRRRGEVNALQRPRMTKALSEGLGKDPWLCELALRILTWVGVPSGVGASMWPLDSWAALRARRTGDTLGSTPQQAGKDVEAVLDVMRLRPDWYRKHVEGPLERKAAPIGGSPGELAGDPRPLHVADAGEIQETRSGDLAALAVMAIRTGLLRGEDPTVTVVNVLTALFLNGTADEIDLAPGGNSVAHERLSALLGDPARLSVLVDRVQRIVREATD